MPRSKIPFFASISRFISRLISNFKISSLINYRYLFFTCNLECERIYFSIYFHIILLLFLFIKIINDNGVCVCVCAYACLENNKWQYLETRYMWLDDTLWLRSPFSRLISLTHFFHREKRPWLSIHGRDTLRDTPCKKGTSRFSLGNRVSSSCHDIYDVQIVRLYLMHSRHLVVDPSERRVAG